MTTPIANLRPYLQEFDLTGLFREGLGWDNPPRDPLSVTVDGHEFTLKPVAQKRGFLVYQVQLRIRMGRFPSMPFAARSRTKSQSRRLST